MKRLTFLTLLLISLFLCSCKSREFKQVLYVDLRGGELNYDGEKSTMREGYLALSSRPSDKSWQLSFKLPGYDALVLDPTCSYQVNAYYYIFSNGPVRMVVGVSDEDPGILVETDEDVTITVTFWPSIEKDIQKIQKAFNKYIFTESYYTNSSMAEANPDSLAAPVTTVEEVYEQEYDEDDDTYEPEVTPIEEVEFEVELTEENGEIFYDGASTPVFSDLIRKLAVNISSRPGPNFSSIAYAIDYSGQIGKEAVAVMTQYKDKKEVADFVFEDGSRQKYAVRVYDYTNEDLWDREIGLGRLVMVFSPKGYQTKTEAEVSKALMLCNQRNISRIEFGDRSVELLKHGFQTKLLFGTLFSKMKKKGAFGEAPLEEKAPASSQKKSTSTAKPAENHQWVDLGLSVKWATCNVGASTPGGYGNFYAWGEISPKKEYKWNNYTFWTSGDSESDLRFSKYNTNGAHGPVDNKTRLDLSDDVAHRQWGGSWRIPTNREWMELWNECTWTWTSMEGHSGYEVTSNINGKSIFLPAAGEHYWTTVSDRDAKGYYWSSDLDDFKRSYYARGVSFKSDGKNPIAGFRNDGFSVRPVME